MEEPRLGPTMSALGQKQTCAAHKPMSAKVPIADIDHVSHTKKETASVAVSPKSGQALCSGGSGLSVDLQEGQQVSIYRVCLGSRAAVREVLVGL